MLKLQDIHKTYQGRRKNVKALQGVSLDLKKESITVLQGPSGCGKTTLLLAAGGLLAPDSGTVQVGDDDVYSLDIRQRAALRASRIGFVFQQFHLTPYLSVIDNLMVPTLALGTRDTAPARDRAKDLLEQFGLSGRVDHFPDELSTGERQRTALARAMMNRPDLILADEPTGNLDSDNAETVLGALELFTKEGGTVLIVSHDARAAARGHHVWRMADGRLLS